MSGNTTGKLFNVTTFGESHGLAMGCIIDGCPPGMSLSEEDIQIYLDKTVKQPTIVYQSATPGKPGRIMNIKFKLFFKIFY